MSDDASFPGPESSMTPDKLRGRLAEELREALARGESPRLGEYSRKYGLSVAEVGRILEGVRAMAAVAGAGARDAPSGPPPLPEDYEVLGELGRGAMGIVYRARQRSLGRVVAVKVLRPGDALFVNLADRFRREVQALAKLRHPHIVAVHEVGEAGGHLFFSMDLVEGRSLHDLVAAGEMTPTRSVKLLTQVASAIAYTHAHGLVHRDLKPGNILVDAKDDAYVVDFGLARDSAIEAQLTGTGQILGTPAYMSPEQARGDAAAIGEATDVYALGAVLYECLTRRAPFEGKGLVETIRAVAQDEPPAPRSLDPRIPRDLEVVCQTAMAKEPQRRYPSAQAFQEDLERFVEGLPIRARPVSLAGRLRRWTVRNPALAASVAGTFVALIGGLAVALWLLAETVRERNAKSDALTARDTALRDVETEMASKQRALEDLRRESDARTKALERAEANLAAARAVVALEKDPGTAIVLARDAARRAPTPEANAVLLDALWCNREVRRYAAPSMSFALLKALDDCAAVAVPPMVPGGWLDPAAVAKAKFPRPSVQKAAPSPDRKTVAVVVAGPLGESAAIQLLDAATLAPRASIDLRGDLTSLAYSRDGRTLIVTFALPTGPVTVVDPVTGGQSMKFGVETGVGRVLALDAATLRVAGLISESQFREGALGAVEDVTPGRYLVWSEKSLLAWTPGADPSRVVLAGADAKGFVIRGCVAVDGRVVAVVSTPATVEGAAGLALRMIDVASGGTLGTVDVRGDQVILSPAGNALLAFGERDVVGFADLRKFRATTRKLHVHVSGGSYNGIPQRLPLGCAFTRDGSLVALAAGEKGDGGVWVGDPCSGESRVELDGDFGGLSTMTFLNDDRWLAANEYGIDHDAVHVWDLRGETAVRACEYGGGPLATVPSAAPPRPADGGPDWSVQDDALVDLRDGSRHPLRFADGAGTAEGRGHEYTYSSGGTQLAITEAGRNGSVLIVDRKELRVVRRWDVAASVPCPDGWCLRMSDFHFDAAGSRLLVRAGLTVDSPDSDAWEPGSWAVLDLATSTVGTAPIEDGTTDDLSLSPDGRRVFANSDSGVRVWDAQTGVLIRVLGPRTDAGSAPGATVFDVGGPGGSMIAVGTMHGLVAVYESEGCRRTFTAQTQLGFIGNVEISRDGSHLLVADTEGGIELWRLTDGVKTVKVPDRRRGSLARFSADGMAVVQSDGEGWRRWPIDLLAAADGFVCEPGALRRLESAGPVKDPGSAELRAVEIVESLRATRRERRRPFREDLARLVEDPSVFPDDLRAAAREILAKMEDDPVELSSLAWEVVVKPGATPESYRTALLRARRAAELRPSDGEIADTLGAALYRAGEYAEACDTLERALVLGRTEPAANLAFRSMSMWKVGREDGARGLLARFRSIVGPLAADDDSDAAVLFREAEATIAK